MKSVLTLGVVACAAVLGGPAAQGQIALPPIFPTSPQDALYTDAFGIGLWLEEPWGRWGYLDGVWYQLGIHTLPAVPPGDIISAELRVPKTDNVWTGTTGHMSVDWNLVHIAAADDTQASVADAFSSALGVLGLYHAGGDGPVSDNSNFVALDVTAAVIADLTAGRGSLAWRLEPDGTPGEGLTYFPTVDNTDAAFGDNRGARLHIEIVPEPMTATLLLVGLPLLARGRRIIRLRRG